MHFILLFRLLVSVALKLWNLQILAKLVFRCSADRSDYSDNQHFCQIAHKRKLYTYHSAGKHDRGPLFFTLFSFRLIRSRSTGSI